MKHGLTFFAALFALLLPLLALPGPPAGAALAAFFPPWWSATRVALAAGEGGLVSGFGAGFVALLPAGDPARLRAAGAWWIVPAALLGGCGPIKKGDG